jgi:hypothetical protein
LWHSGFVVAGLLVAGCGGDVTPYQPPVEGMVSWTDGNPPQELEGGSIEFESGGKTFTTGLRPDGTFIFIDPLPTGSFRVRILPPPPGSGQPAVLDPKFTKFETSGLTYNSDAGAAQQVSFKITKKRR